MGFNELVKKISPTLKRIIYKLNVGFGFLNSDDLYQEALLHLWDDFRGGKLSDKTDSYILQGCYFHLKNYLRKTRDRYRPLSLDALIDESGLDLEEILCTGKPDECSRDIEARILIRDILNNGLTKKEKKVFLLCLRGLTTREIGSHLGVSHVSIVKLKSRVREKCQAHIEEF